MTDRLADVEGIGPAHAATLATHGLTSTDDLLERGARPAGRAALAEATGISPELILEWVNHADLFRIRGVAGQYADLLEEAGVDTVVELAQRNPENLAAKLADVNLARNLTNRVPSATEVAGWVSEAKGLPRAVFYDDVAPTAAPQAESMSAPEPAAPPAQAPEPIPARAPASEPIQAPAPASEPIPAPASTFVEPAASPPAEPILTPPAAPTPVPAPLAARAAVPVARGWAARLLDRIRGR